MPRSRLRGAWLRSALAAGLLLAVAAPARALVPNGRLQIVALDVGQGDGFLLVTPLGRVVLIDEGPPGVIPAMGAGVVAQLQALGVTHVDLHVASHYHADHIGNIADIAGAGIGIDAGWDRGQSYTTVQYQNYVATLGSKRRTLVKGQVITLDSLAAHPVTIRCVDLAGAGTGTTDENSKSVVLRISYGEFDAVFGGDLVGDSGGGTDVETLVGPEVGAVELYKVHHHGSHYSSNDTWLSATHPKVALLSVGNGNPYGHPTADALQRMHQHGVRVYWTETGAGAAPDPTWDRVANGQVVVQATWQAGGVDTVRGNGFVQTFTNSGSGDLIAPVVGVAAPNGGEVVGAGLPCVIRWNASDDVGVTAVDLAWSRDGGFSWQAIANGIANTGSWTWTVPGLLTSVARVRVIARDAAGNLGSDMSDGTFSITDQTPPGVTVWAPNGGESWATGSTGLIAWVAADNVGIDSINVDLSLAGAGGPWLPLAHRLSNGGVLECVVPPYPTENARVRVTAYDAARNAAWDLSDASFRIVPGVPSAVAGGAPALALAPPAPNPSAGAVSLAFTLPAAGAARLEVLDVSGRIVWAWSAAALAPGLHALRWEGRGEGGRAPGAGLYFVRLVTPWGTRTARMARRVGAN